MAAAPILEPRTRDELVELARAASRDRTPLPPVSTRHLDRVIAHEPGDLTLTAECGVTIRAVQDLLASRRQFVAFDPPDPAAATIGGVIAAGRDGPMAARFGLVRDQVLGLTVVNGDGRVTKAGGRVVKNVTGYDLCRLYTGSRGALGIILEATVRVKPRPERGLRLSYGFESEAAAVERGWRLREKVPEIASIQVVRKGRQARLHVLAVGLAPFVEAVAGEVDALCSGSDGRTAEDCDPLAFRVASPPGGTAVVQVATLPAKLFEAGAAIDGMLTPPIGVVWDVLRGVRESWHEAGRPPFRDERALDALLAKHGATLDCPEDPGLAATIAERFPSQVPGGAGLMEELRKAFDPEGVLATNPLLTRPR